RQLLRRLEQVHAHDGLAACRDASRRPGPHDCVLPPAVRALRRSPRRARCALMIGVRFPSPVPRDDAEAVRQAIDRVLASGWFILGPEVEAFEQEFADACGAAHAVGVGTGTDAIALILRAMGIGPGDEVITTPLTAAFTGLAIMMAGATP